MGSLYYTDAADLLRDAGLTVVECDGWKTRARSSGGFSSAPLGIQWHHTASKTTPENDTSWQTEGSDDAPIGNATIMRDGSVWMVAAGASNTAGKGGPLSLSRGTVPLDSGNSTTWAWEVANNGVGEPWPQVQIDAYFLASIVMNRRFGNKPEDIFTHSDAGGGWTDRKIDPATAAAVQGPWKPRGLGSSGTWHQQDCRDEIKRRAGGVVPEPGPEPEPEPEPEPGPPAEWVDRVIGSMPTLKKGASGTNVRRLQHFLALSGQMSPTNMANFDGVFGSGTESSLNKFKATKGAPQDGVCNRDCWDWFMEAGNGIPTIKKGSNGMDVKRMQRLLSANGFMDPANQSNFDGVWGNGTDGAKAKFDNAHGLTPSPPTDCGAKSWESLLTGKKW